MSVGRICSRDVDTTNYDEPVLDSAHRMRDRQVGTVIVVDDMRPVGILTDRDLTVRVLAAGLDPQATRVSEVMTPSPRPSARTTRSRPRWATCVRVASAVCPWSGATDV